jgi:hypothetical protein
MGGALCIVTVCEDRRRHRMELPMKQELSDPAGLHCTNCSTPLQGEFCHACGQSIHSVLKPVHGMMEDALDLVLNVDGRVVHTLHRCLQDRAISRWNIFPAGGCATWRRFG